LTFFTLRTLLEEASKSEYIMLKHTKVSILNLKVPRKVIIQSLGKT